MNNFNTISILYKQVKNHIININPYGPRLTYSTIIWPITISARSILDDNDVFDRCQLFYEIIRIA